MTAIAAFDSGNLLAVATALRERYKDKPIIIAGDDNHRLENNPGRTKAIEVAAAVKGFALFPNLTAKEKELGLTDFNDLAIANPRLAKHQLKEALRRARQQGEEQTGQIKTSEDRSREQDASADNEMDGEDAMKIYNELVNSPGDRLALEKEIPSLIAARDKAVAKQKQLQKETAQIALSTSPKMRRWHKVISQFDCI